MDYAAKPYLEAMMNLDSVNGQYGADNGRHIVSYFLSNSGKWKGDVATRVKAELKQMVGRRASAARLSRSSTSSPRSTTTWVRRTSRRGSACWRRTSRPVGDRRLVTALYQRRGRVELTPPGSL